jgi:hypothetical protein
MYSIKKNILNKQLILDKAYTLNPINGQYDINEINKRQNNSFYIKIIQKNNLETNKQKNN